MPEMNTFKYGEKGIFIFGAPRSGTSWLAKMFDAHPNVLYRHEPDISNRGTHIPFVCSDGQVETYAAAAALWLDALAENRRLKSSGTWPVFEKSFHNRVQTAARRAAIIGLKLLERVPCAGQLANSIEVPDFLDLDGDRYQKIVVKSVSCMGRAGLIASAAPESRIIVIVRHPCGQVASMIRGIRGGMFEDDIAVEGLWDTPVASRLGLTRENLAAETLVGKLAWSWVVHNELAAYALRDARHVRIVRYIDLAERPEATARMLFEFCGLDWRPKVTEFLASSTRASGHERYYQLVRDPVQAATKWLHELPQEKIKEILRIVNKSKIYQNFFKELDDEYHERVTEQQEIS